MTDSSKHKIFIETDCISEQTMFDYIDKKLNGKESHLVEKHMLHCELCSDAMDGLELTKNRERISAINQKITEHISPPPQETKIIAFNYKLIASIAAAVLLLIGGVFFFNQYFSQKDEIAEFKSETSKLPILPNPPPPSPIPLPSKESNAESVNPQTPGASNVDETVGAKAKLSMGETRELEQQPAQLEEIASEPDSKTRSSNGAGDAVTTIEAPSQIIQTEEKAKLITAAPAKSNYDAPQSSLYQSRKDDNAGEMKKSEALGGASNKEISVLSDLTASKASSPRRSENENDAGKTDDKAVTKSETAKSSFLSGALKKSRSKEKSAAPAAGEVSYAPKKTVNDGAPMEVEISNDKSGIEVHEEDVLNQTQNFAEQMPEFPGGNDSLALFIRNNFKYPANFKNEGISNKVYVTFIVDKEGKIKEAKIIKGVNAELDKEALRVVNAMPKWKPGKNGGKVVSVNYNLPIKLE